MFARGVKLHDVSEVLGHSSIRMTADVDGHVPRLIVGQPPSR
jgi:hypothetical protein